MTDDSATQCKYGGAVAASNQLQLQLSAANGDTHTATCMLFLFI